MQRCFLFTAGLVCLLPGVLQTGGWAQRAVERQPDFLATPASLAAKGAFTALPKRYFIPDLFARPVRAFAQAGASASRPAGAINSSWNGGAGNWNVNGDWTPGTGFPNNGGGNTYNVTIGTGNDNVTLNTSVTISSLTLGTSSGTSILQNLSGSSETLTDLGALTINAGGQFVFTNGSTLTVAAGGSNAGLMDLDQGSKATITGEGIYRDLLSGGATVSRLRSLNRHRTRSRSTSRACSCSTEFKPA